MGLPGACTVEGSPQGVGNTSPSSWTWMTAVIPSHTCSTNITNNSSSKPRILAQAAPNSSNTGYANLTRFPDLWMLRYIPRISPDTQVGCLFVCVFVSYPIITHGRLLITLLSPYSRLTIAPNLIILCPCNRQYTLFSWCLWDEGKVSTDI